MQTYKIPSEARAVGGFSKSTKPCFWDKDFEDSLPNKENEMLECEKEA